MAKGKPTDSLERRSRTAKAHNLTRQLDFIESKDSESDPLTPDATIPFTRFPPEIRSMVYQEALVNAWNGHIDCFDDGLCYCEKEIYCQEDLALTKVSKMVRNEALPIFYSNNVFTLNASLWPLTEAIRADRSKITPFNLGLISYLHLAVAAQDFWKMDDLANCYLSTMHLWRVFKKLLSQNHRLNKLSTQSPVLEIDVLALDRRDVLRRPGIAVPVAKNRSNLRATLRLFNRIMGIPLVRILCRNPTQRPYLKALEKRMMAHTVNKPVNQSKASLRFDTYLTPPAPVQGILVMPIIRHRARFVPAIEKGIIGRGQVTDKLNRFPNGIMPEIWDQILVVQIGPEGSVCFWERDNTNHKYQSWILGLPDWH